VTGDSAVSARYMQAVLGAVAVVLVGALAWRIWDARVGLIALTLAAVFPPLVVSSTTLISEALVVPLVLASVVAACEARRSPHTLRWIAASGALAGLVALTRPNGFVLLIPLAIAAWKAGSDGPRLAAGRVAVLVAVTALTVAPWTIRNAVRLDAFVPVSTGTGFTVAGTYNDTSAHFHYPATWLPPFYDPELAAYFPPAEQLGTGVGPGEVELDRRLRAEAREYIRENPGYVAKVAGKNLLRLFGMSGEPANVIDPEEPRGTARLIRWSLYAVLALALIGLFTRKRRRAPWYFWLVPILFASAVLIVAWMRFRAPIDPFLIVLAALAIDAGWQRVRPLASERHGALDPAAA
jgi:4-amino-4-deoxy-L-arabinose transferase-like glycosyltransferase